MRNQLLSLLTVTAILHAGSATAQDQTAFIHADDIVPYQEPAALQANAAAPAETLAPQESHPSLNDAGQEQPCDNQPEAGLSPQVAESPADVTPAPPVAAPAPSSASHYVYPTRPHPMIEPETRTWLALQTSGSMAGSRFTTPGQTATQIYQRYLKSFSHPIPNKFEREPSTSNSSGN